METCLWRDPWLPGQCNVMQHLFSSRHAQFDISLITCQTQGDTPCIWQYWTGALNCVINCMVGRGLSDLGHVHENDQFIRIHADLFWNLCLNMRSWVCEEQQLCSHYFDICESEIVRPIAWLRPLWEWTCSEMSLSSSGSWIWRCAMCGLVCCKAYAVFSSKTEKDVWGYSLRLKHFTGMLCSLHSSKCHCATCDRCTSPEVADRSRAFFVYGPCKDRKRFITCDCRVTCVEQCKYCTKCGQALLKRPPYSRSDCCCWHITDVILAACPRCTPQMHTGRRANASTTMHAWQSASL